MCLTCYVTSFLNDLYSIECSSVCDDHADDPVCGTNGLTYGNFCQLEIVACRQKVLLNMSKNAVAFAYEGVCTSSRDASNARLGKFIF